MLPRNSRFSHLYHRHGGLIRATLRCRLCARAVGDLVGHPRRPLQEARFFPLPMAQAPVPAAGELRCARCGGQLELDEVEPLGRAVTLQEVGGDTLGAYLHANVQSVA